MIRWLKRIGLGLAGLLVLLLIVGLGIFIAKAKPDIPLATLQAQYADAASYYADLPGGIRMHYREEGKRDGPVILFIHGLAGSSLSWKPWAAYLGDKYRLIGIDLPGHGLTAAPDDWQPSPEAYADAIEAFARTQKLGRATVIGASFGGQVAWTYALRHSERVSALVLISAAGWPDPHPPKVLRLLRQPWMMPLLSHIDTTSRFGEALRSAYADPAKVTPAMVARYADMSRGPGHRRIIFLTTGSLPLFNPASTERLAKIEAPTLILHGTRDNRLPLSDAHNFNRAIKRSQLIIYKGAAHALADEIAPVAARDVRIFLEAHHVG